jgi:hypothetical protein
MSTATAQIHLLHQLIRIGEIDPGPHQRVTMTSMSARVEVFDRSSSISKRFVIRPNQKRRSR